MRRSILVVALVMLGVIQTVPYGAHHTNPPVRVEPPWDSERTRRLAGRLCFDCHSNATVWPWFSQVAPISWLIQRDVEHGRGHRDHRIGALHQARTAADGRGTTARDRRRPKGARQTRAGHG